MVNDYYEDDEISIEISNNLVDISYNTFLEKLNDISINTLNNNIIESISESISIVENINKDNIIELISVVETNIQDKKQTKKQISKCCTIL